MKKKNSDILLSQSFVIGLLLLVLNDFVLKQTLSNPITGKLSDFAGLFIFPMFLTFLFPKVKKFNYVLTMFCFILWKLPISYFLINLWNNFNLFSINRVIDYTDYLALLVLPISYCHEHKPIKFPIQKIVTQIVGACALIAFCSTAGTHGSMGGYKYPISKDSLETAINAIILENKHIERPTLDSTDYYNTGGYITVEIGTTERREYLSILRGRRPLEKQPCTI